MEREVLYMEREMFFRKCSFCNVFEITDKRPSGDRVHAHEYTQIWYVTKGQCEHYVEDQKYLLTAGDAFIIPPKMEHKTILLPNSSIISCEVVLEAVLPQKNPAGQNDLSSYLDLMSVMIFLRDSKSRRPRFMFRPDTGRQVKKLMEEILMEYTQQAPCWQDLLRVKIQELLLLFIREFIISPDYHTTDALYEKYKALMDIAIRYIEEHYTEPLTLEDVCRVSTLSKTYFCYLFKLITHKTFVEYLNERRIRRALQLLDKQDHSILEVSEELGFNDASHFSRTFKKIVGVSPRDYRKIHGSSAWN